MMAVIIELDEAKGLLMTAYLLVDMLGGQTLCAQVVQHQINLDRIAVEALVDLSGLDQVANV